MQKHKHQIEPSPRTGSLHGRKISRDEALLFFYLAMFHWLIAAAYALGQFDIKHSELILNREGCMHLNLLSVGVTPLPQDDTCRTELPFRSNILDAGGRIYVGERTIQIPERQLIAAIPLAGIPWISRQRWSAGWMTISTLLVMGTMWLSERCRRREAKNA